jgi:hypothetical protein
MTGEYENTRRLVYGDEDNATFIPVCEKCGRFVKADEIVFINDRKKDNATCSKCGRTKMLFEGYM